MFKLISICIFVLLASTRAELDKPNVLTEDAQVEDDVESDRFPDDFMFGATTSAFQIEGGWNEGGRTPSSWDVYLHEKPDTTPDRTNADVGPYSYRYWEDDIEALKSIGANTYRISISWSRVLPNGDTTFINEVGLQYYDNLINKLVENKIEPIVTIHHYDFPHDLHQFGGFTNILTLKYFEEYAKLLFDRFADRVKYWVTINEPFHSCLYGYGLGQRAPDIKAPGVGEYLCVHNMLKAHAMVYHLYRNNYYEKYHGKIGVAISALYPYSVINDTTVTDRALQFQVGWVGHPIYTKEGDYPEVMRQQIDLNSKKEGRSWSRLPTFSPYWKKMIRGSADFFGLNYYSCRYVEMRKKPTGPVPSWEYDAMFREYVPEGWKRAKTNWLYSYPPGIRDFLKWIDKNYNGIEVLISENGFSTDGDMVDHDRIEYLRDHIEQALIALKNKETNLKGYLVWSLIDNFEWLGGFSERFGLFNVNFTSPRKERTPRLSASFIRELYQTHKIPLTY